MKAQWVAEGATYWWKDWLILYTPMGMWDAYKLDTADKYPAGANPYLQNFATCEEAMHWCETMEVVGA